MLNPLNPYKISQPKESYSWIDYTIDNNGIAVLNLVEDYGYPEASDKQTLKRIVYAFINDFGDEAYYQLKQIHPDYKLFNPQRIENYNKPVKVQQLNPISTPNVNTPTQPQTISSTMSLTDDDFFKRVIIISLMIIGIVQVLKAMPNARS